jgi:hypothetical protein
VKRNSWCGLACSILALACGRPVPQDSRFEVEVRAISDDGSALPAVKLASGEQALGTTGPLGSFRVRLAGTEGQTLPVAVTCPDGFAFIGPPVTLRLSRTRRVNQTRQEPIMVSINCTKQLRDVVVVVRSEGGASLPVQIDGKDQAVTDEGGTAHVLLQRDRASEKLSVTLDTSRNPRLRPQNPTRTFELHGRDAILIVDQAFTEVFRPRHHANTAPTRRVPYKVQ